MSHPDARPVESASFLTEHPVRVLLVDDQLIVGEAVRRMLATQEDITFCYCSDPAKAIQTAIKMAPTVILQDLIMPEVDGLMLARFFRANPMTREIPLIVLSSKEEAKLKAEAFAQGVNDYLVKLPDKVELIARIRYHSNAYINYMKRHEAYQAMQYTKELELVRQNLEKRVEERTLELRQALKNLQQTQAKLIQTEKMSSLGQLVAGVAHEINNPVNFIHGNITHLGEYTENLLELIGLYQENYPNPLPMIRERIEAIDLEFLCEDLPKILDSMKIGTDRIRQIVLTLRNFSRLDEADMKTVDIHEGIDSTLLILQNRLKATSIEVVKEYGKFPLVECYAGELNQAILNILTNAIDGLEESGVVSPKFQANDKAQNPLSKGQRTIRIRTEVLNSESVSIKISDNGRGMTEKVKARLFDPFFTTKPVGKGTGLGLWSSYQIVVEKHKGSIGCVSEPGQGSEFCIEIPLRQKTRELSTSTIQSTSNALKHTVAV